MLIEEGGKEKLVNLLDCSSLDANVKEITFKIMELLASTKMTSKPDPPE